MNAKDRANLDRAMRYAAKARNYLTRISGSHWESVSELHQADRHLNSAMDCIGNAWDAQQSKNES